VRIRSLKKSGVSQWYIEAADIRRPCEGEWKTFTGVLRIQSPVIIEIERISSGPIKISIKSETGNKDQIVAKLYNEDINENFFAAGCLLIIVNKLTERTKKGKTMVLPVDGYIEFGREARHETLSSIPVLRICSTVGTKGYKVRSSLWVRFGNDPAIKVLIAAVFFILGALATWRRWWKESHRNEKSNT
jgi:hypothetical protein